MKILLVSDTHGKNEGLRELLKRLGKIDALFHMGDSEERKGYIEEMAGCPVYMVKGNCDYGSTLPYKLVVEMGGHKFYITHGDHEGVNYSLEMLKESARMNDADVALFGHTHQPVIDYEGGVTAVNPGSLSQPRPYGSKPTYILMEIDEKKEIHYSINELPEEYAKIGFF